MSEHPISRRGGPPRTEPRHQPRRGVIAPVVERLVRLLVRRPWTSLLVIAAFTAVAGWYGAGVRVRGDMEDLFPENTPSVVRAKEARRILGSVTELRILIGSDDGALNKVIGQRITDRFDPARAREIDHVEFRRDIGFFETNALLYLPIEDLEEMEEQVTEKIQEAVRSELGLDDFDDFDDFDEPDDAQQAGDDSKGGGADASSFPTAAEIKERYNQEGASEYFESPDGKALAVKLYPVFKPADAQRTGALNAAIAQEFAAIERDYPDAGLSLMTVGDYRQLTEAVNQIARDATRAALISLALIVLLLAVYFRRLRAALLVMIPLIIGLVWTVAFATLSVGYFNLITVLLFSILLGLGVDFAVHAVSRVEEEYAKGATLAEALPEALAGMGRAMFSAAATTAATFLVLIVLEFRGFSQLGLIAGVGVLLSLLSVYLVLPPLVVVFDRAVRQKRRARKGAAGPGPDSDSKQNSGRVRPGRRRLGVAVLVIALAGTIGGVVGIPDLTFEADMRKLRPKTVRKRIPLQDKYNSEAESRNTSPALVITDGLADTERLHRHLEAHMSDYQRLTEFDSIYSLVPEGQADKLAIIREMKRKIDNKYGALEDADKEDADRLRTYLTPAPFGPEELPPWVRAKFTDTDGNLGRYLRLFVSGTKADAVSVLAHIEQIGAITVPATADLDAKTYLATASWFILSDAYLTVRAEGPIAVLLALLVVLLWLIGDLRDTRDVLTALLPLIAGFCIFLGVLAWLEIPLTLYNIIVLPAVFGIGVDTTIHLLHRLNEGSSLAETLRTTGSAAAISSLTDALAFGALIAIDNEGVQSLGLVAVIGITIIYLVNVGVMSALVVVGFKRTASAQER